MSRHLLPRGYDPGGRLQMAEGRLSAHTAGGTAVEDLFLVHHYPPPDVTSLDALQITGTDASVATVSHEDVRALPTTDVVAVLECAGNGRGLLAHRTPGNQFGLGLFGQSRWRGARLTDLLDRAGFAEDQFATLVVRGADEGLTQPENSRDRFAKALPRGKALHPDTIVAWQVDGQALPAEHGGPMRLVVPGWYGIWWVKWPTQLVLTNHAYDEFDGFWQTRRYTYQDAGGTVLGVVRDQLPRAVLVSPREGAAVTDREPLQILAWAGEQRVTRVDVSVDDGDTWQSAALVERHGTWGWSRWETTLPDGLPRGLRRVAVRASDDGGRTQHREPAANRLGYGCNGIHVVQLDLVATPGPAQEPGSRTAR